MKRALLVVILIATALPAFARRPVPLMPERRSYYSASQRRASNWAGYTVGLLGMTTSVPGNIGGVQSMLGGNIFKRLPISEHFYFKPSAGLYAGHGGAGGVTVTRAIGEVGASMLYVPSLYTRSRFQFGVTAKADISQSLIGSPSAAVVAPPGIAARGGITLGLVNSVDTDTSWFIDAELTAPVQTILRPYLMLGVGVMFRD